MLLLVTTASLLSLTQALAPRRTSSAEVEFAPLRLGLPHHDSLSPPLAALVDWDGDGDLDILRGQVDSTALGGRLELLENDGHARFQVVRTLSRRVTSPPRVGDLDGDGRVDAWVGDDLDSTILLNDGAGGFTAVASVLLPPLALADLDGDGALDWMAETHVSFVEDLRWARNRGDATFEPEIALGVQLNFGGFVASDLDADGDVDLVHVFDDGLPLPRGWLELLFNDGAAGFADRVLLALPPTRYAGPLAAADVDSNGFPDLLLADPSRNSPRRVLQYRNLGARQFQDVSASMPLATVVSALTAADLDGDGALDLALGHELLLNDGRGSFRLAPGASGQTFASYALEAGDLDGDGDVDLLLPDRILLGDGSGALLAAGAETIVAGAAALGDLDGDGWLDALGCPEGTSSCGTFFNDRRGVLVHAPGTVPPELTTSSPRLGDLDGDGDLDFLHEGTALGGRNDGTGTFSSYSLGLLPNGSDGALGDLDGDGDLDGFYTRAQRIFCHFGPCYRPDYDALILNDGSGAFVDGSASFTPLLYVGLAVALGDLEQDGDLDVLTNQRVLQNDGAGGLVDRSTFWGGFPRDLAVGDVDADGDADVVLASDPDQLAKNDGSGGFTSLLDLPGAGLYLELADVDGDLDLDVIESTNGTFGDFVVQRNDRATFVPVPQFGPLWGRFALGDLDRDGDPDLLDGRRVLSNLHRSLSYRGVPRIGQPVTLALQGAPLHGFVLVASRGLAPRPTPPFGLLQIDPGQLVRVELGLLDGAGRAERTFAVPRDAALIGATWHWQALLSAPTRWSGRETTTLVGF